MKKVCLLLSLFVCVLFLNSCVHSQNDPVFQNNIRSYLSRIAEDITDNSLAAITTISGWEKERTQRLDDFYEMMGLQDYIGKERTSLNVKTTGIIQRDGYRIEKLYYESLPGLYVPANLYIPDNIEKPVAAILYVNGHSPTQNVQYQAFPAKFAQLGFVCLIIETIQFGEVRGEHWGCYSLGWFNWYSRGYNPAGVELWNAIRGIDLLASRPEVDAEKMGVTGISGGGSQSWYIAAADARIKAVAPVCGASTLKAQIGQRTVDGHCDCMMPINTYRIDFQNIGALIAPRPLLIGQADRDEMNTIESVRQLYDDIKKIYALFGKTENISFVETPGGHSYHPVSREAIHSFFLKHLMGKDISPEEAGDIDLSEANSLSAEVLKVYVDGVPADDRTTTIQDSFVKLAGEPVITDEKSLLAHRDSVKRFLQEKTFGHFPKEVVPFDSRLEFRSIDGRERGWDIFSFVPEEGWRLNVDFHWRNDTTRKKPLLIILKNYDERRWGPESFASEIRTDWNIAYLEVRGVGEAGWDPALQWHIRRAAAWTGRTIASMQVYDLLRCIEFCRTLPQVDPEQIGIAAKDEMTVVALYAAIMDGQCQRLVLKNPVATQDAASRTDGKGDAVEMLNCLRVTDVNRLPALIFPTKTNFIGDIPESYQWSQNIIKKFAADTDKFPPEMVRFKAYANNPIFSEAEASAWDSRLRERGYILFMDGIYKMWYTGYKEKGSDPKYLGYATSTDGIHWERSKDNPIFDEKWTEDMIVIHHEDQYYMFAEGKNDIAHYLTSPDGIHWQEQGDLIIIQTNGDTIPGPYGTPTAWVEAGQWYLFYERDDQGVWLATSDDNITWKNVQDEPVLKMGPDEYDAAAVAADQVIKYKGRYYMYYHASYQPDWATNEQSLWTSNVAMSTDLIHWEKYPGNPIVDGDTASPILVYDGDKYYLYTMHDKVRLFLPETK